MDCTVTTDKGVGRAVVVKTHTGLVYREANGVVQVDKPYDRRASMNETHDAMAHYGVKDFYEFATGIPLEEIAFLKEAVTMNKTIVMWQQQKYLYMIIHRLFLQHCLDIYFLHRSRICIA